METLPDFIFIGADKLLEPFLLTTSRLFWGWWPPFFIIGLIFCYFQSSEKKNGRIKHTLQTVFSREIWLSRTFLHDLILFTVNQLLKVSVLATQFYYIRLWIPKAVSVYVFIFGAREVARPSPAPAEAVVLGLFLLISIDAGWSVVHYLSHKVPFLWQFHKVHHSAPQMNPISERRFHPLEQVLLTAGMAAGRALTIGLIFYIYADEGMAIGGYFIFVVLAAVSIFRHSNIWISFGPLNYLISSPAMHQIHHSNLEEHQDKNMCLYLPLLDALMGTLYIPKTREKIQFGLIGDSSPWTVRELFFPWTHKPSNTEQSG